jgi:hypothetical protein
VTRGTLEAARHKVCGQFEAFAEIYTPGVSPLYEALSRIVIQQDELLDLAAGTGPGQPAPNMLFGAVQMILLGEDRDADLGRYYPSVGGRMAPDAPGLEETFLAFCRAHRARLSEIIGRRVTNTNEVRRSACLMPAYAEISRALGGAPFHLVEIGPSAGLNLIWDRYAYRYLCEDGVAFTAGDVGGSGLVLECALRGPNCPDPGASWPPPLASRIGIERNPVDLTHADDRLWLRALIWPEHRERAERLDRALTLAVSDPPPVRTGDALELLPELLGALPQGDPVCVVHSFVLYQFSPADRGLVRDCLAHAARERPVLRISYESQADRPEALLSLQDVNRKSVTRLAFCDSHGSWLEWHGSPGAPS